MRELLELAGSVSAYDTLSRNVFALYAYIVTGPDACGIAE